MRALRIKPTPPSGLRLCPPPPPQPLPPSPWNSGRREGRRRGGRRGKEGRDGGEREGRERGSENERQGLVCGNDGAGREGGLTDTRMSPPLSQHVLLDLSPSRRRCRPCQRRNGQVIGFMGRARAWRGGESSKVN
jgi:hypothetical protein